MSWETHKYFHKVDNFWNMMRACLRFFHFYYGILMTGWCQNWMFSPTHGYSLGKYKPFGEEKNSFLAHQKKTILSIFTLKMQK